MLLFSGPVDTTLRPVTSQTGPVDAPDDDGGGRISKPLEELPGFVKLDYHNMYLEQRHRFLYRTT